MKFQRTTKAAALVAAAALTTACASRKIGEAQDAFNDAARIEAASMFAGEGLSLPPQSAASKYERAVGLVDQEIAGNGDALAADKLLGVAYTLKAMSQWRIADLRDDVDMAAKAGETVDEAMSNGDAKLSLGPRDKVALNAAKGLADVVRGRVSTADYADPAKGAKTCFTGALKQLEASVADPELAPEHPVRMWVALCELRTCQAWLAAVNRKFSAPGAPADGLDVETKAVHDAWKKHVKELKPFLPGNKQLDATLRQLATLMGISETDLKSALASADASPDARFLADFVAPTWSETPAAVLLR
jgi:hypothetical protein